ncbi:MAG: NosD domain-containing protein [Candidatus Odinarchaeota archaeon]
MAVSFPVRDDYMYIRPKIYSGLAILLLIMLFPTVLFLSGRENAGPEVQTRLASIQAQPIVITGNDGFGTNFTGSGTPGDPYVLKDVVINVGGPPGINISNTDKYFRIENVIVNGSTNGETAGIHLTNVTNGQIINSIVANSTYGFGLVNSSHNALTGNTAYNNTWDGFIVVFSSKFNTLTGNTAYNNGKAEDGVINMNLASKAKVASTGMALVQGNGFTIQSSSNNTLTGNTAYNNSGYGFYLFSSSDNNTLTENSATGNINGFELLSSSHNTLSGNSAFNNSGVIVVAALSRTKAGLTKIANVQGEIAIVGAGFSLSGVSNYNTLVENTANENTHGFSLSGASNFNTLVENTANENTHGFYLYGSSFNTLTDNNAYNNGWGVDNGMNEGGFTVYASSHNNTLIGNNASKSVNCFYLGSSSNNTLSGNTAINSYRGFSLWSSSHNNTMTGNTVYNSTNYGIVLSSSSDNLMYFNFFIENYPAGTSQGYDSNPDNNWTNGTHGNYWSDYAGIDDDGDGIGGTNYTLLGTTPPVNDTKPLVFSLLTNISTLQVTGPGDQVFEAGSTGIYTITWLPVSNLLPTTHKLYVDEGLTDSGNWTSKTAIQVDVNLAALAMDTEYNYTLVVSDYSGKTVVDTVLLTVKDRVAPVIDYTGPAEITFETGSTGNTFNITATDLYPGNFTLYQNGTGVGTYNWTSGTTVTVSFDDLSLTPGVYTFKLVVRDTSGNEAILEVKVTVTAKPAPSTTTTTPTSSSSTTTTTGEPSPGWTAPFVLLSLAYSAAILSLRRSKRKK